MQISSILKDLREDKNITQKELAKACGISPQCVSALETGRNEPTASTLIAYSNYFKIPIDELLGRDEITADERAAGASATKKISVSPIEYEMLFRFRDVGKKRGIDAQQSIIDMLDKMM